MPIGYLITVAIIAAALLLSVAPLARSGVLGLVSWILSAVVNESPLLALYWMALVTALAALSGDLVGSVAWIPVLLAIVSVSVAAVVVRRARPALDKAFGDAHMILTRRRRLPWFRILVAPLPILPLDLERTSNVRYGDAGRATSSTSIDPASAVLVRRS